MTIEQRKLELITWISAIQSEGIIERIENLRQNSESSIPDMILELLHESSAAKTRGLYRTHKCPQTSGSIGLHKIKKF